MAAHSCPFLLNCVNTISAGNTEMAVSQGLRKRIAALREKEAASYAIAIQLMLSQTSDRRIIKLYKETGGAMPFARRLGMPTKKRWLMRGDSLLSMLKKG
jgi:hypothetical protein